MVMVVMVVIMGCGKIEGRELRDGVALSLQSVGRFYTLAYSPQLFIDVDANYTVSMLILTTLVETYSMVHGTYLFFTTAS